MREFNGIPWLLLRPFSESSWWSISIQHASLIWSHVQIFGRSHALFVQCSVPSGYDPYNLAVDVVSVVKNSIPMCNGFEDQGNWLPKPSIFMTGSYLWIHAHHFWVSHMRFASNKQREQWKIPFIDDFLWLSNGTWRFCIAMFSHLSHRRNSQPTTALSSGLAANTCQVLDLPSHLVPEDSHRSAVHGILCGEKKQSPSPCFPVLSLNVVFFLVVRNHKPIGFKSLASIQLGYSPKNHVPKMDPATDGNTPAFCRA